MTPPDFHGNAVPTLDTADDTGTQPYSKRKEKKRHTRYVNTSIQKQLPFTIDPSSALIVEISQSVFCNISGTW